MVTIICPVYNEEKYIRSCIDSLLKQESLIQKLEILFIDGMSVDKTREIIYDYSCKYPFIRLIDNVERTVPYALNKGVIESQGDIIVRIDAHAKYPVNYLATLVSMLELLNADNVGASCETDVLVSTPKSLAIKEVMSNKIGVGNSTFRLGVSEISEVDTVPFGCWRKKIFERYGMFDVRLTRNQDIEFNKRIKRGGGKIFLVPGTHSTYFVRETFKGFGKNNYLNGKWNMLTVFYTRQISSLSIRHFIPLLFISSLFIPIVLSVFFVKFLLITFLSALLYLLLICFVSFSISINKRVNVIYLIIAFSVLHFSYGIGSISGLFNLLFLKKYNNRVYE